LAARYLSRAADLCRSFIVTLTSGRRCRSDKNLRPIG
jgi:hypothetical protein